MKEFLEDLAILLEKHEGFIEVKQEEDDSFLYLNASKDDEEVTLDTGYRDLLISSFAIRRELQKM